MRAKMLLTGRCRKAARFIYNPSREKSYLHRQAVRAERAACRAYLAVGDWDSDPRLTRRGTDRDLW